MKYIVLFISALIISAMTAGSGAAQNIPKIEVGENVHLDFGNPQRSAIECFLAINPVNPNHLLAVAISADPSNSKDYSTIALVSFDGSKSWKATRMPTRQAADPWGIILPDGTAVVGDIGLGGTFRQMAYTSPNGGLTWREGLTFGDGHDHDMFLYDQSRHSLYLLSTRKTQAANAPPRYEFFLARSTDSGKTFPHVSAYAPFPNLHFNAKTPALLSDGTLVIPFLVGGNLIANQTELNRWEHTHSWLITSGDGGKTFAPPLFITDVARRSHSVFAVNPHARWKDYFYYVFAGANRNSLHFMQSADRGQSWSPPRRLDKNTDAAAFVDVGAMAVNANGLWAFSGRTELLIQRANVSTGTLRPRPMAARRFLNRCGSAARPVARKLQTVGSGAPGRKAEITAGWLRVLTEAFWRFGPMPAKGPSNFIRRKSVCADHCQNGGQFTNGCNLKVPRKKQTVGGRFRHTCRLLLVPFYKPFVTLLFQRHRHLHILCVRTLPERSSFYEQDVAVWP